MLEPLLKKEKTISVASARLMFLIFALGCVGIISAKYLFLQAEQEAAPRKIEKVVGVWADMQVKTCVSVKDTCIGKWITENIDTWQDAIEPAPEPALPRAGGATPRTAKMETALSGSQRKLLSETIDIEEQGDYGGFVLGNLGGFSDGENANSEFLKFFGDGAQGLGSLTDDNGPPRERIFPGEARVPYICRDYNEFPEDINCSPDETRWVKAAERRLGDGAFGEAYVGEYNMNAAENAILSPHYQQGKKVVTKRAMIDKVSPGELVLEAVLMFAVQSRVADVGVRAVDVYLGDNKRWLITQPLCDGDINTLQPLFQGNIPAVMYMLSELYGKLDALHKQAGLAHRDIKPKNLLYLVKPFRILLGDLGSALPLDGRNPKMPRQTVGMTKDYWAPEYVGSVLGGQVDYRTCDLWAATFSAFELYYGVKLWSKRALQTDMEWEFELQNYYEQGNLVKLLKQRLNAEQFKDPLTAFFLQTLEPKPETRNDAEKLKTLALRFYDAHKGGEFDLDTFAVPQMAPAVPQSPVPVKVKSKPKPQTKPSVKASPTTPKKPSTPAQSTKSKLGRASDSVE